APTMAPAAQPTAAAAPVRTPKDGGIFRMYLHTENAPTLDPYFNTSFRSQEFAGFFYSRLIMSTKGPGIPSLAYIFEGDLAESWKVSDDGLTYTFNIRPDVRWQNRPPLNARPVTAQDVAWSFERFMKVAPHRAFFEQVG